MTEFYSGKEGLQRSDCRVVYKKTGGPLQVMINSKVQALFGQSIRHLALDVIARLGVDEGEVLIDDYGALPYVIAARIEATLKKAEPWIQKTAEPVMKAGSYQSGKRNLLRLTRLYLPGNQPKYLLNAGLHKPDGVILDLEDSVATDEKISARLIVRNALRTVNFYGAEKMVRINQGEQGKRDLDVIAPENVNVILLPKVEAAEEVIETALYIKKIREKHGLTEEVYLMPIIESAKGVLNAAGIARAHPDIVSLAIGLEDYTADIGTRTSAEAAESLFARSMVVNAAAAAGIGAQDSVYAAVTDTEGLLRSAQAARQLGFEGKGCIHPGQIATIRSGFAPCTEEIARAQEICEAYKQAVAAGSGVVSVRSKMIDAPVVKKAQQLLAVAVKMGLAEADAGEGL